MNQRLIEINATTSVEKACEVENREEGIAFVSRPELLVNQIWAKEQAGEDVALVRKAHRGHRVRGKHNVGRCDAATGAGMRT